jgi:hypothetical protein
MARKFLTPIDLNKLELQNAAIQNLATAPNSPNTGQVYYDTVQSQVKVWTGAAWVSIGGGVSSLAGTADEITVSASVGAVTLSLPATINANTTGTAAALTTARTIALTGDVTGTVSFDGSASASMATTIAANSVALGTDTTGNYIASVSGTANEIEVSGSGEGATVTVGLTDNVSITGDLTVGGNLTISGSATYINAETIQLADNTIILNSNATGSATENAGIEVERGTDPNVAIRWNEGSNVWELTKDGSTYTEITAVGDVTSSDISDFNEAAQDAIGTILGTGLSYNDSGPGIGINNAQLTDFLLDGASGSSYGLIGTSAYLDIKNTNGYNKEIELDIVAVETKLVTDGFAKKVAASVGNASATSFAVVHNLGTRDVTVNVYDNANYETVVTDVVRTDANTVTVSFAAAPSLNAYRVVVVG